MFSIQVNDDPRRFGALRNEWNALLASSRADCVFLTWEWLHTWWNHLGSNRELFIITVRQNGKLVAVAPLMVGRSLGSITTLEFLGTGSIGSDYLDFIVDRAYGTAAIAALTDFINDRGWTLRLPSVREDSFAAAAAQRLRHSSWRVRNVEMQVCPYIDLAGRSWDDYLASLGPSHRYNFRRRLRNLQKEYDVRFERAVSKGECREALGHVVDLHLRRWELRGGSDGFHNAALLAFHREFSELAREEGWLRLRLLKLSGHVAGAFYGFRYRGTYLFYQSGFDESFVRQSVGLVMIGLTIQEAVEEGAVEYDMLHGDESYKFLWTSQVRPLYRIELYPPGVVGGMHRNSVVAVAATKRIVKRALYASFDR